MSLEGHRCSCDLSIEIAVGLLSPCPIHGEKGKEAWEALERRVVDSWVPAAAELVLEGVVTGSPATAGSKRSGPVMVKGPDGQKVPKRGPKGRIQMWVSDDQGEKGKAFRSRIIDVVEDLYQGRPLDAPLVLELLEYRPRKDGDFGTGRNAGVLKDSAPAFPATRPDISKILRAFEDALAKVVIREDSRFVRILTGKDFDDGPARVEFRIWVLPAKVGDLESGKPVILPVSPEQTEGEPDEDPEGTDRSGSDDRGSAPSLFPGLDA